MEKYVLEKPPTNQELTQIAEGLVNSIINSPQDGSPGRDFLGCDYLLYGSLSRRKPAKDIDLMIFKSSYQPEDTMPGSTKASSEFISKLFELTKRYDFFKYSTSGVLDLHLLPYNFFLNLDFRIDFFKKLNCQDPFFFYNSIMRDGLLYNRETMKFDMKAKPTFDEMIQKSLEGRIGRIGYY